MKRWMNFFDGREEKSRLTCHWDGISLAGAGSIRLSNFPKNLSWMAGRLLSLGKKSHAVLFYSFAVFVVKTSADDCNFLPIQRSNIYLSHQNNNFLWIVYDSFMYSLGAINNTCNFTIADKQSGNYTLEGCFCNDITPGPGILYGQNVSPELVNCMMDALNCKMTAGGGWFVTGILVIAIWIICCCCCGKCNKDERRTWKRVFKICDRRPDGQPLLLNTPNPEAQPDFDDKEQSNSDDPEPPPRRCLGRFGC